VQGDPSAITNQGGWGGPGRGRPAGLHTRFHAVPFLTRKHEKGVAGRVAGAMSTLETTGGPHALGIDGPTLKAAADGLTETLQRTPLAPHGGRRRKARVMHDLAL
jgi:hypothetical protein